MSESHMTEQYNYTVVRRFALMAIFWGIIGMSIGVFIAAQLAWPALNFDTAWLSFGRLRPLHTNTVIFAFGGSVLFATSYYSVQRTCYTSLFSPKLAEFTFWSWQLVVILGFMSLPLGLTSTKEYGEYIPLAKGKAISAGQLLERFLFDRKKQYDFVEKLSGGELKRLFLCTVLIQNPNFLILDEPTNDLDIITLQVLENFLLDFPGNLIVIDLSINQSMLVSESSIL